MALTNPATLPSQPSLGQSAQIQLHDIHLPEQISNFPIAPGWWLLLALLMISAVWLYRKRKQVMRINACKKQALAVLANNPKLSAKECIALLKWAAMQYVNRQQLAKLYGTDFQQFLTKQLPQKHQNTFAQLSSAAFKGQYQAEKTALNINSDCHQATKLWLTHALPIIAPLTIDKTMMNDKTMPFKKEKELS
ncbi:DUF4381 domain-containing protein [Colwellia psychrerythraea]|uniref:DUF4381 domain-containing protein n=1 Tax=Colwellia psychrerythraea TaxID=28229 RepID=A0A099K9K1_COLPS|nr:DUF4381 domain-containing protein [Colwellia psychrerythraea]KGJ86732.1 hypothetical protein ND2E_0904 [Colwellia psychrerythraea]